MPRKSWWARLPFGVRMVAGASALLLLLSGGVAGAAVLTGDDGHAGTAEQALAADPGAAHLEENPEIVSREAAAAEPLPRRHVHAPVQPVPPPIDKVAQAGAETSAELSRARAQEPADRTGARSPHAPAKQKPLAAAKSPARSEPVITTRTDVETRPIPFRTRVIRDDTLPRGFRKVQEPGAPGEQATRYLVTLTDGKPSDRRMLDTTVTRQPQQRVVVFGVQREQSCVGALDFCLPLGRTACTDGKAVPTPPPAPAAVDPATENGSLVVTDEDLALFDPESRADVRLEPATVC